MRLHFLGTGAGVPSTERNVTAIAVDLLDERGSIWLFDCGEATQHQILRSPVKLSRLEKIFITHLHGDHVFGLPGLLSSRSFQGGTTPLSVYGPAGLRRFLETALNVSATHLTYPIEVEEIQEGTVFADETIRVDTAWLNHGVPCLGYRITEANQTGTLLVERLRALGIPPGPLYGRLKRGETVRLPDGRELHGRDFVGPDKAGRVVTVLGDTAPCEAAVRLARGADVLVHEATFASTEAQAARAFGHSTSEDAARTALQAGAKQLILTHISARYSGSAADALLHEARAIFPESWLARDGAVFSVPIVNPAEPLDRVPEVPPHGEPAI